MARERSNAALDSRGSVRQAQQDGARRANGRHNIYRGGRTVADAPTGAKTGTNARVHVCFVCSVNLPRNRGGMRYEE
jgi:hypothetical protein